MFENFKTDIIYYNTATDFEMEFNLCGCCRMRLLNDKCSDKKSLLLSLSRAVSRSNIIIISAPLFSNENITKTVATAIGTTAETLDNDQYNINSNAEIQIIKGSTPLVTADGAFGGCLIQSGPQTLILLTDNKGVRKNIMQNLIHPYVKEIFVCNLQKPNDEAAEDTDSSPTEPETITTAEETQLITEEPKESEEVQAETEEAEATEEIEEAEQLITDSNEDSQEENYEYEETENLIITPDNEESTPYIPEEFENLFTDIEKIDDDELPEDDDFYYEGNYYTEAPEERPSAFNFWFIIISIILLITVAILCVCIFYIPTKAGLEPTVYLQEIFETMFS